MIVGVLLALLTVCLAIGMPISHAMGLSAVLALALEGDIPLLLLAQRFYDALDSFPLLAVPLFVLAGELMNVAGITSVWSASPGPSSATSGGGWPRPASSPTCSCPRSPARAWPTWRPSAR